MSTKITKHYFKYGNKKYFRSKAEDITMGAAGKKYDPIGANAYLAVEDRVQRRHLEKRVRYSTTSTIYWSKESKSDVDANGTFKFFGINLKTGKSASYSSAKSANLKLVKFVIDEGPLKRMLNNDANIIRNYMADEGKDARIVSMIWIVVEAELAEHFKKYARSNTSVKAMGQELEITVSGGSKGSQTIRVSPGTCFAYAMHKVKKWNKGKTRIEDMEDDFKGMG